MRWDRPEPRRPYIRSDNGRFYISKSLVLGAWVYTLADKDERVCTERGEGALERCKQRAEERV